MHRMQQSLATMSHESVYDSERSSFTSPDLVSLLVQAKKDLQHAQSLASEAQYLVHDGVHVAERLAGVRSDVKFVHALVENQARVVEAFRALLKARHVEMEADIKIVINQARTTSQTLNKTLDTLSLIPVEPSIAPHLHRSHSHESLFGSQSSSGSHTALESERRKNTPGEKTLRDFVDEQSLDLVLESGSDDRNALEDLLANHANLSGLLSQPPHVPPLGPVEDLAHVVDELLLALMPPSNDSEGGMLSAMARELEGLGVYFEGLAEAVQNTQGATGLSNDELQVFHKDSQEVPSILAELEHAHGTLAELHGALKHALDDAIGKMQVLEGIVSQLDAIGLEMVDISAEEEQLAAQIPAHFEGLKAHHGALEELNAYYERYKVAYAALVTEMERRKRWLESVDEIVHEAKRKVEALRQEEFSARSEFVQEHGEFLPDDLCPDIGDLPPDINHLLVR